MVAPYEVGEPVRSFVRVPTKDQAAKALCWDLSRASPLVAASAPVRQHLLRAQPHLAQLQYSAGSSPKPSEEQLQAQPKPVEPQAQAQPVEPQTQSQPVESQAQSVEPQAQASTPDPVPAASQPQVTATPCDPKRRREEEQEGEVSTPEPTLKVARMAGFTVTSSPAQPQQCPDKEVQSLRRQCQLLQQQNNDLQRRLNLFHGLFQDKQRLKNFVRHLDTLVK